MRLVRVWVDKVEPNPYTWVHIIMSRRSIPPFSSVKTSERCWIYVCFHFDYKLRIIRKYGRMRVYTLIGNLDLYCANKFLVCNLYTIATVLYYFRGRVHQTEISFHVHTCCNTAKINGYPVILFFWWKYCSLLVKWFHKKMYKYCWWKHGIGEHLNEYFPDENPIGKALNHR